MQLRIKSEQNLKKFMDCMYDGSWIFNIQHGSTKLPKILDINTSDGLQDLEVSWFGFQNLSHDRKAAACFLGRSHGHCGNACFCHSCSAMARSSLPHSVGCRPMRLDATAGHYVSLIVTGRAGESFYDTFLPLLGSLNQTLNCPTKKNPKLPNISLCMIRMIRYDIK